MKVANFLVKSNYIKPAKDTWVICEVRLLTDNADSFLCVKSLGNQSSVLDGQQEDAQSLAPMSEFSATTGKTATLTSTQTNSMLESLKNGTTTTFSPLLHIANRPFTALCNLAQYKSCDIRTANIEGHGAFALKLVPLGMLNKKRLLLATDDEEQLTQWLAMIKSHIGKSKQANQTNSNQPNDSMLSMPAGISAPSAPSSTMGTLTRNQFSNYQPFNPSSPSFPPSFTENQDNGMFGGQSPNNRFDFHDFDDDDSELMDNDVYEPYSVGEYSEVTVEDNPDSRRLNLQGKIFLRTSPDTLELIEFLSKRVMFKLPYKYIRRYGAKNGSLRIETGRRCSTGVATLAFRTDHAAEMSVFIREAARSMKQASQDCDNISLASVATTGPASSANNTLTRRQSSPHANNTTSPRRTSTESPKPRASSQRYQNTVTSQDTLPGQQHNALYAQCRRKNSQSGKPSEGQSTTVATPARAVSQDTICSTETVRKSTPLATPPPLPTSPPPNDLPEDCCYDNMSPLIYGTLPPYSLSSTTNSGPQKPPRSTKPAGKTSPTSSNGVSKETTNGSRHGSSSEVPDQQKCIRELDEVLRELGVTPPASAHRMHMPGVQDSVAL